MVFMSSIIRYIGVLEYDLSVMTTFIGFLTVSGANFKSEVNQLMEIIEPTVILALEVMWTSFSPLCLSNTVKLSLKTFYNDFSLVYCIQDTQGTHQ